MATQYTGGLSTGQVLTAATMNSIGAAWETYTPVFKTGATTRTATINYARFSLIQKVMTLQVELTCTEIGTVNGALSISIPTGFTISRTVSSSSVVGSFFIADAGTAFFSGSAILGANIVTGIATSATDFMGANSPALTIAVNDKVSFTAVFEVN